jgi:hypothetical protein
VGRTRCPNDPTSLWPECLSHDLNANSQIRKAWFWEQRNRLIIWWRGGQGESTSQNSVVPLLRENVHFLKESSGAQLDYMTKCMPAMAAGLDSLSWTEQSCPHRWCPGVGNGCLSIVQRSASSLPQGSYQCPEPGPISIQWDWDVVHNRLRVEAMKPLQCPSKAT